MFEKLSKMLKIFKFAAEGKLKDGTAIFIDGNLAEGTKIFVITSEGNLPLPDGSYEMEDGVMITVEGGVIVGVEEPKEDVEPTDEEIIAEEDVVEPVEEPVKEEGNEIQELKSLVDDIVKRLEKLEGTNSDLSTQNQNFSIQIEEFKTKLESVNGAEPIKKKVENLSTQKIYSNPRLQVLKNMRG